MQFAVVPDASIVLDTPIIELVSATLQDEVRIKQRVISDRDVLA